MKILELTVVLKKFRKNLETSSARTQFLQASYIFLFFLAVGGVILGFGWAVYIIWWLLGFGWSLFFFRDRLNFLEHLLLGGITFVVLFTVFTSIFAIISLQVNLVVFLLFLIVSFFVQIKNKVFSNVNWKIDDYDYLVLLLFLGALVAKGFPLRNYFAAPLHDPISHAMMAKKIVDTGLIEYFYSPGLHILSSLGTMMEGFSVAKQVMILTGILSSYTGIVTYVFIKKFYRDKVWAVMAAILFSLGYYPMMLTFNAGKNTLIMALPILFFVMFATTELIRKRNTLNLVISILAIYSLFLAHYPTAVIGGIFVGALFVVYFKELKWKGFLVLLGVVFGLVWMGRSYQFQLVLQDSLANPERTSVGYVLETSSILESIKYYLNNLWTYFNVNLNNWNKIPTLFGSVGVIVLFIRSCIVKSRKEMVLSLWILLSFLFYLSISILKISELTILFESHLISLPIYIYVVCGYILSKAFNLVVEGFLRAEEKWGYILAGFLVAFILVFSYVTYKENREFFESANYVSEEDMEVFSWMDRNVSDEEKVLINAHDWRGIIFSSDAGGYLEVFTGNEVSTPFYEYDTKQTHSNYDLYEKLKENLDECLYREEIIEAGYRYYYQGSILMYSPYLAEENLLIDSTGYDLLKKSGSAVLFEIKGCGN